MEFNPSIHIKKSELIRLFKKYDLSTKYIDNLLADAAMVACLPIIKSSTVNLMYFLSYPRVTIIC